MAVALFFGPVGEAAGGTERALPAECDTVRAALDWLVADRPALAAELDRARTAVGGAFVGADHSLGPRDELSILSPASGG